MEEKGMWKLSWATLFTVIGFSFLSFSLAIKLLDGNSSAFFSRTGFIACILGLLSWLLTKSPKAPARNNRTE